MWSVTRTRQNQSTHSIGSNSMQEEQLGWVNHHQEVDEEISTTSGSDEYIVKSIMKKNAVGLKIPNARI